MIAGRKVTTDTANRNPAFPVIVRSGRKTDNGSLLLSLIKVRGCSIRLQYSRNPSTSAAIIPKEPMGSTRYQNNCHSLAPSSLADSIKLSGISAKNRYMIKTGNVENIPGRMTAHRLSSSRRRSSSR